MPWPSTFNAYLEAPERGFVLGVRRVDSGAGLDNAWQVATNVRTGWHTGLGAGLRIGQNNRVTPRIWQPSAGQMAIPIIGDNAARLTASRLTVGSLVEVLAGRPGSDPSAWQTIGLGWVTNLTNTGGSTSPTWTLTLDDFIAGLRSRWTQTESESQLFRLAGEPGALSSDYTIGDSTISYSGGNFERLASGDGVIRMRDTGTGADFYLKYSGDTGSQLTGVSSTAQFGTTAANVSASSGTHSVINVAYLRGSPLTLLKRLLLSTGSANFSTGAAGTNGNNDLYPETWGLGLSRDLVAVSEIDDISSNQLIPASGLSIWEILIEEPIGNALTWLRPLLAKGGVMVVQSQGKVSARIVHDPVSTHADSALADVVITDAELVRWSRQIWDPNVRGEARKVYLEHSSGTETWGGVSDATTLPFVPEITYDFTEVIRTNGQYQGEEILNRLAPWESRVPGVFTGTWASLRYARLCVGDVVEVSSPLFKLWMWDHADNGGTLDSARAVVTAHSVNWTAGTVDMQLHFLPES